MRIREPIDATEQITEMKSFVKEPNLVIKCKWPRGIDVLCMFKTNYQVNKTLEELIKMQKPRIFTKEEYLNYDGILFRIDEINLYRYYAYPCEKQDSELTVINQNNADNVLVSATGKANIRFKVIEKKKPFSNRKKLTISITTDTYVPRKILCYIKKRGGVPESINDGTKFNFLEDFEPGKTDTAAIDVAKDEYVKVFLSEGKVYGEIYDLKSI